MIRWLIIIVKIIWVNSIEDIFSHKILIIIPNPLIFVSNTNFDWRWSEGAYMNLHKNMDILDFNNKEERRHGNFGIQNIYN